MKRLLLALTVFALAGFGFINAASADDTVKKELQAVYAKIDAAIKAEDLKTLESMLAKDYEKRIGDKTLSRDEAIVQMKRNFEMVKKINSVKSTIDKIQHVEGNEIVDYTQTVKGTVTGPDGKDQSFDMTVKGRDWWVKDDEGKWSCVAAERKE